MLYFVHHFNPQEAERKVCAEEKYRALDAEANRLHEELEEERKRSEQLQKKLGKANTSKTGSYHFY